VESDRSATILHTNDFHNKLSSEQANFIRMRKSVSGANTLLFDAGDAISAGNVGVRLGGEPILERMGEIGYDAMTLGNREFHVSDSLLRHKIGSARFPVLCANISYQKQQSTELPVIPYVNKTLDNGLKLCIIGVTVPMVTSRMAARAISSYLFGDPVECVCRLLPQIRKTVDVVIALTHIGIKEDQRLAEACPSLDLIIGGHSHVVQSPALLVGAVPIVQAGWFGHYLGRVDLVVGKDGAVTLTHSDLEELLGGQKSKL
jgi:2',3'-cyclic-nucleotide 2'-phosphodiesterase (5'-nucleotidase family)